MIEGRIRDFETDTSVYFTTERNDGRTAAKRAQANFRAAFKTQLVASAQPGAAVLAELPWGTKVALDGPITNAALTRVTVDGTAGFVATKHLVEIAYVGRGANQTDPKKLSAVLDRGDKPSADLLWGDMVQVIARNGATARVRARGLTGTIATGRLKHTPLLECYFIDVGQGDGVLIRFPDGQHMLIDGGLARSRQQTGKNAADFVDWKFFTDYGDWAIDLDWMIASHSDSDHFGGLADLVEQDRAAREELDTIAVRIAHIGHPGLSRFPASADAEGLGPHGTVDGHECFTRLLGDRADAELLLSAAGDGGLKLSGQWKSFFAAALANDPHTQCDRIGLDRAQAAAGDLPLLDTFGGCEVRVLAPVTLDDGGAPVLPDLTPGANELSINTNGHSVCLRLDFGAARILLTGDLNAASMRWLSEAFTPAHLDAWRCDVAKACHHGSHDVSFKFLEAINAAATVISSGDNEGHAHPRPEIVGASAISGRKQLSPDGDRVITPLVYMTEIERSVLLSAVNRIELADIGSAGGDFTLLGKPVDEFGGREFLGEGDWDQLAGIDRGPGTKAEKEAARNRLVRTATERERGRLTALEQAERTNRSRGTVYGRRPAGVIGDEYLRSSFHRMRVMEKNVYGLVNVRTDGELVMCASKRDDGEHWTVHAFKPAF